MPSKGKRVAVRESNLRRRRSNRSASGPAGVAAGAVLDGGDGGGPAASATATATATAASGVATGTGTRGGATRAASQPRGRRRERPAAYNHVGSELIRIGIFASVALAALIAVSFVL